MRPCAQELGRSSFLAVTLLSPRRVEDAVLVIGTLSVVDPSHLVT